MRTVTVENLGNGKWAISTEFHDGIVYLAENAGEAVKKYEADRDCVVGTIHYYGESASEQLILSGF